ncbi:hypothetical protein ACFWBF_11525 [Streptomyces sp. NPDC060028]|uniref:hypothetical protein n=1 Tax=Streptomyces sp. NPDC060028 TaxID=3347041 RepID=UPI00369839E4
MTPECRPALRERSRETGAADAGEDLWSRAVVESVDGELVRATLRGPGGAGWAADRLMARRGGGLA